MTTNDDEERELARLIATGMSYANAGSVMGMSKATVYRRMQDPAMREAVGLTRVKKVDDILAEIAHGTVASISYLREVVEDERRPDALRVKAANQFLMLLARRENALSATVRQEMHEALEELEVLLISSPPTSPGPDNIAVSPAPVDPTIRPGTKPSEGGQ